uniref:RdRp n=1 Tax=Atrato Sobemo-like virus 1 TaxID=2689347 RepID=A0A6B9KNY4_9VIRU|nr:RdRp [Atrato Sobemo-like virus 1]
MRNSQPPKFNERVQQLVGRCAQRFSEVASSVSESEVGYEWPGERRSASELDSLRIHAQKYFKTSALENKDFEISEYSRTVLYYAEKAYSKVVWRLPDDFDSYDRYVEAVMRLDWNSSPGIPYCFEHSNNRDWLKFNGVCCDSFKLERLWHDVQLVLSGSLDTVLRVFIKQEPHKTVKAKEGRWRLIMAAPLCVQVAWHMLFDFQNDKEIDQAYYIPSQQGMNLVGGGWKQYRQQWLHNGLSVGLDKSAWDWTAPSWALNMDLEFRYRMGRGDRKDDWMRIARMLYRGMFDSPLLVLSDGTRFRQVVPGIMKSGCVNTISTNSHMQFFIHVVVCMMAGLPVEPWPVCCGDDTLQHKKHTEDLSHYARLGVIVKTVTEGLEFMGHDFTEVGPQPMYMAKHLKKMLYTSDEILPDYFDSMARMYVHTRYYDIWEYLAQLNGTPLAMSREAYLTWYDYSV